MIRFDVLKRDLDVLGAHFLEASAGTGKTFAIEHFVTRLILEKELKVEEILVVTFTKAATRELKARIRSTLLRTQRLLQEEERSLDYVDAIFEKGTEAVRDALKRIETALIHFDTAQIFTLHGFCFRALKEHALEAQVGLNLLDPDKAASKSPLFEQWTKEFLKTKVSLPRFSSHQMELVLKKYRGDVKKLIATLSLKIQSTKCIASFSSLKSSMGSSSRSSQSFLTWLLKTGAQTARD